MLRELLVDHVGGIAGARDESIDALVERALAQQLIEGRRTAARGPHVEERHAAAARARPTDRDLRGEVGVATAADRNEHAPRARERTLHHGDVARRIAQDVLDRRSQEIPARPPPREQEQIGALGRDGLLDRLPALPRDGHERTRAYVGGRELVQRAPETARLGLHRGERVALGHLDRRDENELLARSEGDREIDDGAVALRIDDRDEALHAVRPRMTGSTRSRRTRGQACSRARTRIRITGVSSARSTASAICSPLASGGT